MSEQELDDLIRELENDSTELYNFVAENTDALTDDERDELIEDLQGDPLSLRDFVMNSLED